MTKLCQILFIFAACFGFSSAQTITFTNGCPNLCACQYIKSSNNQNILLITCTGPQLNFNFLVPDSTTVSFLSDVTTLVIRNSYLQRFPSNICTYGSTLITLDLSKNSINQNIDTTTFACLTKLQFLNISSNLITGISSNAFDFLTNLVVLDMSYNQITFIPPSIFYMKMNSLTTLKLDHNLLTEIDIWFVYLKSIVYLDMSYNQITKFVNTLGFSTTSSPYEQIMSAEIVDFRFNKITKFDDSVLLLYSVCNLNAFAYFLRLFQKMQIENNPIDCSCSSYNLLSFYQQYINSSQYLKLISNNIFLASCATPSNYNGRSIYTFVDIINCPSSLSFNGVCPVSQTTPSPITIAPNQIINTPQLQLADDGSGVLKIISPSGSYIAGIIVAFLGALILFLLLLYCICPIEILAVLFDCMPCLYAICPCKSGQVRNKEYDLFISYNLSTEKWVHNVLIPFIQSENLVKNYVLHYDSQNRNRQVFNSYVSTAMQKSSIILLVLNDAFLLKEWNNVAFRLHLKHLVTKEKHRFLCIQMHDVNDETVEDYFRKKLKLPYFVSLECDEFLFWKKLGYHLYTNNPKNKIIEPVYQPSPNEPNVIYPRLKYIDSDRSNEEILTNKKKNYILYNVEKIQQKQQEKMQQFPNSNQMPPPKNCLDKIRNIFLLDEVSKDHYISDPHSYYSYDPETHNVKVDHPMKNSKIKNQTMYQTTVNEKKRRNSKGSINSSSNNRNISYLSTLNQQTKMSNKSKHQQNQLEYRDENSNSPISDNPSIY